MHRIIEDSLEEALGGTLGREQRNHLESCASCRAEVEEMRSVALLVRQAFSPAAEETPVPLPGFYSRLSQNLETKNAASPWALLSIDAVFGRRVAFASLLTLALVGGFLISRESDAGLPTPGPEAIIAQHEDAPAADPTIDRDRMMVTLASYEH